MRHTITGQSDTPYRSPAAAHSASRSSTPASVEFVDNRPEAITQRKLADAIHTSSDMVAQRRQLRGMFGKVAQLQGGPEEELLQGKLAPVQRAGSESDPAPRKNHIGLPDHLKSGIESISGLSMDDVTVHYNSSQPAQLNALAYTQGTDIHVAPGQEQHLPHEAWHVVQQAQGRVQPTMQMKDGVSVNDDQGLEHEADVMGARAAVSVLQLVRDGKRQDQTAFVHRPTRLSWSYPGVLSSSWRSIAQLMRLPEDSKGQLSDFTVRENIGQPNDTWISGRQLQTRLINALSAIPGVTQGSGYRLVSFRYDGEEFEKDANAYHQEKHGMQQWPVSIDDHLADIRKLIRGTLKASAQLDYLNDNFAAIDATHTIIIDVDWYLQRTQADVGFHKDSRGTTLFVNLTYNNDKTMQGAATKLDREGQPALEEKFPEKVRKDLEERRQSYQGITLDDQVGDLKEKEVGEYARLSFSDPSVWHSTPLLGHRVEKLPPPKDERTLATYLTRVGLPRHLYLGIAKFYETGTEEDCQSVYRYFVKNGRETVKNKSELIQRLIDEQITNEEIDGFQNIFPKPEVFWAELQKAKVMDPYNRHGISEEIEPVNKDTLTEDVKNRSRRLSLDLNANPTLQNNLDEEAKRPRTFIRTWVRLVPKLK
jgi:Domain of unknown function (DUF4157)